jgi:hypothetical protein
MPKIANSLHLLNIPGLTNAVSAAPVSDKHLQLLRAVRQFEPLSNAQLATVQDYGGRLVKRKVLSADGIVIHDNHQEWLRIELEADAGHAGTTRARLMGKGYLLSECKVRNLYLVHDRRGTSQSDFLQVEISIQDEFVDRELFTRHTWRDAPRDLRELVDAAEDGYTVDEAARRRLRPSRYELERIVDVARFVEEAEALEAPQRNAERERVYVVSDSYTGKDQKQVTMDDLSPGWDRFAGKSKRIFDDWAASSAGRSGARICEHWVMKTTDWTDDKGRRWLTLIPAWTFDKKMAKVECRKGSAYELFGKLEKIDQRTKAPFAWYFYMLHGNKVDDDAGKRILAAAEEGLIVLPEHDYRVLKAWRTNPYGY